VQLVRRACVVLEVAGERGCVRAALAQGLAGVARLGRAEIVDLVRDERRPALQHATALDCGHPSPGSLARAARSRDRPIDVGRGAARDLREHPPVGGVDDWNRLAAGRRLTLVVDEQEQACGCLEHGGGRWRVKRPTAHARRTRGGDGASLRDSSRDAGGCARRSAWSLRAVTVDR